MTRISEKAHSIKYGRSLRMKLATFSVLHYFNLSLIAGSLFPFLSIKFNQHFFEFMFNSLF